MDGWMFHVKHMCGDRLYIASRVVLAAALAAACVLLGGCAGGSSGASASTGEGKVNTAVVVGACANQPVHSYAAVESELEKAVSSNGYADIVVADSTVTSELGGAAQVGSTATNPTRRAQEEEAITASLMNVLAAATADSPQTDVIRALRYAASGLAALDGTNEVCLLHSGFSTDGVVDLVETPEWLQADPEEVASALADQLPDLSAIDVLYWYDFGYTAGDQPEPDQPAVSALQALWEAVLVQAGVGRVEFVTSQVADEENASEYEVDAVDLTYAARPEVEAVPAESTATIEVAEVFDEAGQVEFPESQVEFVPDTANLLNEDVARSSLSNLVEVLLANPDIEIYVTGSCAGCPWDSTHGIDLSVRRAQTVADLLASMGVDAARMTVEGVGDQSNDRVQHIADIASDGMTQTVNAQLNRRVVITRK